MWWSSTLRQLIPAKIKHLIKKSSLYVKHRSTSINIYHCCVAKTGSQWIKAILADSRTYRYSGLETFDYAPMFPDGYDPRKYTQRSFRPPFPQASIVSPLYIDFENFLAIPKPDAYKAFFVMRDPRDIVVSWYFSVKHSHPPIGRIPELREVLNSLPLRKGILHLLNQLENLGVFCALRSWAYAPERDPNVLLVRFEELTDFNSFGVFRQLFAHCDIGMPDEELSQLLQDYSFERLSGRKRGNEDKFSYYRKGVHGDWKNYFDEIIIRRFKEVTSDLITCLGYEESLDW